MSKKKDLSHLFPCTIKIHGNVWKLKWGTEEECAGNNGLCDGDKRQILFTDALRYDPKLLKSTFWHEIGHALFSVLMVLDKQSNCNFTWIDLQEFVVESLGEYLPAVLSSMPKRVKDFLISADKYSKR